MNPKDKKSVLKKYTSAVRPPNRAATPEESKERIAQNLRRINQEDMMKPKIDMSKAPSPLRVLGGMAGRVAKDVVGGVKKAAGSVVGSYANKFKAVDAAKKARDDGFRAEGEALKSGAKMGVLKKVINAPAPLRDKLPKKLPTMMPKKVAPMGAPLLDQKPKMR